MFSAVYQLLVACLAGCLYGLGPIGFILSAFIGAADVAEVSHAAKMGCWKGVFAFEGLPALMVILLGLRLPESPIWLKRKEAHGSGSDSCSAELMPTRIRAVGMSIALLCNQGVSTALQSTFLPLTERIGFGWLFIGFAACTIVYWCAVQFFLPETKGRTLEEIETFFTKDR